MFNKSILNEIRDRIPIAAFIGERIPLKRAGRNFKGRCPFHNEKTPSFNVSDEKQIFHCFGCGEGGDIFKFVMKFDGLGFAETVKFLAGRAGIELPRDTDPAARAAEDEAARKKRLLFRVNEIARDYFSARLSDPLSGARATAYLQHRGIKGEFLTQLFPGYAENSWDQLAHHLKEKNVPLELAAELGLVKQRDSGGYYDFFRDRLMFPIISPRGEVLGFSGRELGSGDGAKYLNSPDSAIYHKSNCVYGLNLAQNAIRSEDHVILVEGYMDLIALYQAGILNVVAPLGTALTAGHLKLLSRYTRNMTVVFDGDEAGRRAAVRSLPIFIEEGLAPRVVELPAGEDPDTLVRKEGAEAFLARVASAPPLFEYFVDRTLDECGADASGRIAAARTIVPMLKSVADPAQRGIYRRDAARRLDVDESALDEAIVATRTSARELSAASATQKAAALRTARVAQDKGDAAYLAEKILVELMLCRPEVAEHIFAEIAPEDFADEWTRNVATLIHLQFKDEGKVKIGDLIENLGDAELAQQLRQLSLGAERCGDDEAVNLAKDCVARLKQRPLLAKMESLNDAIKRADASGDEVQVLSLLAEKRNLTAQKHLR